MSLLAELKIKKGSTHRKKLLGRGFGSGRGGTSGKGHKGQKARSGGKNVRGFEGGQTPMHRRLPKFGFVNIFRVSYAIVNIDQLENLSKEVTPESLRESGMVKSRKPIKVLGKGKLTKVLTVKAHKFSESAKKAIESAGGKAEVLEQ
ncbi:MAG: 50S ribosomal protein L15 [Pseudomonadota bacterium]|nr:50S ribosomal protein L15 [Pseudomonadota bacterium]